METDREVEAVNSDSEEEEFEAIKEKQAEVQISEKSDSEAKRSYLEFRKKMSQKLKVYTMQ